MGMFDKIRSLFTGDNNSPVVEENASEKLHLARQIVDKVDKISRINSFDSTIWNLKGMSKYELGRRSLAQLQQIDYELTEKLDKLQRPEYRISEERARAKREELEKSKWTGEKPEGTTDYEFDRFQRDER